MGTSTLLRCPSFSRLDPGSYYRPALFIPLSNSNLNLNLNSNSKLNLKLNLQDCARVVVAQCYLVLRRAPRGRPFPAAVVSVPAPEMVHRFCTASRHAGNGVFVRLCIPGAFLSYSIFISLVRTELAVHRIWPFELWQVSPKPLCQFEVVLTPRMQ